MGQYDEKNIGLLDGINFGEQFAKSRNLEAIATPGHTLGEVKAYADATVLKAITGQVIGFSHGFMERDGVVTLSNGDRQIITDDGVKVEGSGSFMTQLTPKTWIEEPRPLNTEIVVLGDGTRVEVIAEDIATLFGGKLVPGQPILDTWHLDGNAAEALLVLSPEDTFTFVRTPAETTTVSTHSIKLNRPMAAANTDNYAFSADEDTLSVMRYVVGIETP